MSTLVCVPITMQNPEQAAADAVRARDAGADVVEFRVDEFFTGDASERELQIRQIAAAAAESPLPCIVTCRVAAEGGAYEGDEEARAELYRRLTAVKEGEHPPRYLDCEQAALKGEMREAVMRAVEARSGEPGTGLVLSMHDFQTRPADLTRRLLAMRGEPLASVVKVAYRARSLRDSLELLDLPGQIGAPTIALGMGEFGLLSRILAPKFGGFLTFAALRAASATAPGQPTVRELLDLYRFRSIKRSTAVYGIVGWPVGHSLSPLVHNAGFEAIGHDGVYVPLPIAAGEGKDAVGSYESFKGTLLELVEHPGLNFRGASVTIPHKENLARLARERGWACDPTTQAMGAGNTLVVERRGDGSVGACRVMNTDAPAALECLRAALGGIQGRRVLVLGAGGAAKGIVLALASEGATVRIANRTAGRAEALVREAQQAGVRGQVGEIAVSELRSEKFDAVVNCTPVGMKGGPDPAGMPVDLGAVSGTGGAGAGESNSVGLVVMDTVYNPVRTPLLKDAASRGLRVVDGVGMFVRQAALQFAAWTGKAAPVDRFEALVREELARREGSGDAG